MNNRIIAMLVAWMSVMALHAANVVSVESVSGKVGTEVFVDVSLSTDSPDIVAAEIRIPFPEGVNPKVGPFIINEARLPAHNVKGDVKDGSFVIVVYNLSLSPIPVGEGLVCSFGVDLGDNPGNFDITPIVKLSDKDGKQIPCEVKSGVMTVLGAQLEFGVRSVDFGRVPLRSTVTRKVPIKNSGTETLTISGLTSTVEGLTAGFSKEMLSPGESGEITLTYTPTVRSKSVEGRVTVESNSAGKDSFIVVSSVPYSVNELYVSSIAGLSDEEVAVSVRVKNMEPLVGAEFRFRLPEELEYVEGSIAKSARADAMSVAANVDESRNLRIIIFNTSNATLDGNEGEILTLRLKLTGKTGMYCLSPEKVILCNIEGENMVSDVYRGYITITSPQLSASPVFKIGNVPLSGESVFEYPVRNDGNAPLTIEKVTFLSEGFSCADSFPMVIASRESGVISIKVDQPAFGEFGTTMNLYSSDPSNRLTTVEVSGIFFSKNELSFKKIFSDDKCVIEADLSNEAEIVAMQLDLVVPDGMTVSENDLSLTERAASHSLTLAGISDNRYRLIIFSLSNEPFVGCDGSIFTLGVAGEGLEGKELRVENIKLSGSDAVDYMSPDAKVRVESIWLAVQPTELSDFEEPVDVYTLNGVLVKRNCTRDDLNRLRNGIYILRHGNTAKRIHITNS